MLRVTIAVSHDSHRGWSLDGHGNGQEVVRLCQALDIWNCYSLSQVIVITLVTSKCFALSSCFLTFFASIFNSDKLFHKDGINKNEEISSTSGGREWGMDWAFGQTRSGQILSDFGSVLPPVFKFSLAVAHLNTSQQRPLAWSWPWHMIIFDEFSG